MSMFVSTNGEMIPFTDFLMSEAIVPVKTTYGTDKDASNGQVGDVSGKLFWTVIKHKNLFFLPYYTKQNNTTGFGVTDNWTGNFSQDIEDMEDGNRKLGVNALRVFGNVFYVIIDLVKKAKGTIVKFDAADAKLGKVYDRMVKNKPFLDALEKQGWRYEGKRGDYYIFAVSK